MDLREAADKLDAEAYQMEETVIGETVTANTIRVVKAEGVRIAASLLRRWADEEQ